jgi:hypothetical protein
MVLLRELPEPTLRILLSGGIIGVKMSFNPVNRWYQSKGSGSLTLILKVIPCVAFFPILRLTVLAHFKFLLEKNNN